MAVRRHDGSARRHHHHDGQCRRSCDGALFSLSRAARVQLTGTSAWFFLFISFYKVPFSLGLGLIHRDTLLFNAALAPAILIGLFLGRWLLKHVPQRLFDGLILVFAAVAALQRIGLF